MHQTLTTENNKKKSVINDPTKVLKNCFAEKVSIYEIGRVHQILKDKANLTFKKTQNVSLTSILTFLNGFGSLRWASTWLSRIERCIRACVICIKFYLYNSPRTVSSVRSLILSISSPPHSLSTHAQTTFYHQKIIRLQWRYVFAFFVVHPS